MPQVFYFSSEDDESLTSRTIWKHIAAVSVLGGIGFTVSLFIANLSFGAGDPYMSRLLNNAKLGILVGSFLAGFLGWLFLYLTLPKKGQIQEY